MNKKLEIKVLLVVMGMSIVLMLVGCFGPTISLFSKQQTYQGKDSLLLDTAREDILDIIAEVGREIGYDVSALDREHGYVDLSTSTRTVTYLFSGRISRATLSISVINGGKKLDIGVWVMGNFGTGGEEEAKKVTSYFKAKLLERLERK